MLLSLKFISSKSGKSLALKIDNKTYLFNLFEGFQRFSIQEQFSLVSIDSVFLTANDNIPGLIGAYLTLSETTKNFLNIVTNFDLDFFSVHKYAISPTLKLNFLRSFSDNFISVKMFNIKNTTNYIISLPEIPGSFHPDKIPTNIPKFLYKKLISTGFLEFDGEYYKSTDFTDNPIKLNKIGLIFSEVEEIDDNLREFIDNVTCFFCFTESSWNLFSKFNINTDLSNFSGVYYIPDSTLIEYEDFYTDQLILNNINNQFLLPVTSQLELSANINILYSGDSIIFDKKNLLQLKRKDQMKINNTVKYTPIYPSVEFLGTGCAIPSKYRNVSSILYQNDDSAILLDCGEDTLTQIYRLHGNIDVLKKLKIIYISHSHADHMLGIYKIIKNITNHLLIIGSNDIKQYLEYFGVLINTDQISFISTNPVKIKERKFYDQRNELSEDDFNNFVEKIEYENFSIVICGCEHSKNSCSVNIFDKNIKKSFSYSGDTIPSELFSFISKNCDLMIHEATFVEDQKNQADKTLHSTDCEAKDVFKFSGAKKLLLTHFSNRNQSKNIDEGNVTDFYRYLFD